MSRYWTREGVVVREWVLDEVLTFLYHMHFNKTFYVVLRYNDDDFDFSQIT